MLYSAKIVIHGFHSRCVSTLVASFCSWLLICLPLSGQDDPLQAQEPHSKNCIPDTGCAADEWPPKCCQPPPCELFRALQVSRALRQNRLQRKATAAHYKTPAHLVLERADFAKAQQEVAPCKKPDPNYRAPPSLQPSAKFDCQVSLMDGNTALEPITQNDAIAETNACSEVIEATYEYALKLQPLCEMKKQGVTPGDSTRLDAQLDALQAQIDLLESDLFRYWSACTIVFDAKTARNVAKNGVDALRDAKPLKSRPKPKRAGKSGRRS